MKVLEERVRVRAGTITGPKIIFIGGSSTLMTVDVPRYTRELGRPVVNYGLSAGIPLETIVERAGDFVGPGDLVVLAPEHFYFKPSKGLKHHHHQRADITFSSEKAGWALAYARRRCATLLGHLDHQARVLMRLKIFGHHMPVQPKQGVFTDQIYWMSNLTREGFLNLPRPERASDDRYGLFRGLEFDPGKDTDPAECSGGRALEAMLKLCAGRKAVLAAMPPARLRDLGDPQNLLLAVEKKWIKHFRERGAVIVLEAGETTLDREYAFDSYYHVNDAGAELMAKILIPAIKKVLPQIPAEQNNAKQAP